MSTLSSPPVASSSPSPLLKRNSCEVYPAATFALAKWPASALVTREGRRLPMVTWTARYPSALSFLTCEMRFGNASTTVTGTVTPASVNTRVMPHLRPTRPMDIVNPHTARASVSLASLRQISGLDTRTPDSLENLASAPTRSDLQNGRGSIGIPCASRKGAYAAPHQKTLNST